MKYSKSYYLKLSIVNLLTLVRLVGSIALPFIYYFKGPITVSLWVLVIFSTDAIDGNLARLWKVQSFFGSLLDGVCDKLFSIVSLTILSLMREIMFIPLLLEMAIVIVNMFAFKDNKNVQSSKLGKRKTVLLAGTIILSFILIASPIYTKVLPNPLKLITQMYAPVMLYVLAGIIIGMQILVLTDYSKKAFKKQTVKIDLINKEKINFKDFISILFDNDFYTRNKDKPLREILYKK